MFGTFFVYVGTKQKEGNPAQRAGLVGGDLYAMVVTEGAEGTFESLNQPLSGRFQLRKLQNGDGRFVSLVRLFV